MVVSQTWAINSSAKISWEIARSAIAAAAGMDNIHDATTEAHFASLTGAGSTVVHFWAPWCEPCKHMDAVLQALAQDHSKTTFIRVEAEEVPDLSEKFGVTAVPFFLVLQGSTVVAQIDGADAASLTEAVTKNCPKAPAAAPAQQPAGRASQAGAGDDAVHALPAKDEATSPAGTQRMNERIGALLASAPVLLFMKVRLSSRGEGTGAGEHSTGSSCSKDRLSCSKDKGTPEQPRCGFSQTVVALLRGAGIPFKSFDILEDEAVRQGLKAYSQWPTFPQLYAGGQLLGGCDIVKELAETGELQENVEDCLGRPLNEAGAKPSKAQDVDSRIRDLLAAHQVLLFMKGTPEQPRCGFSQTLVSLLRQTGVPFQSFDILEDGEIRQGLKTFSEWPTFPQLYVHGELIGGCDIVKELAADGELQHTLQAAGGSS